MCLSIAIEHPENVLARGEHLGLQWVVTNNGIGFRCGYVRVPVGHPWHGMDHQDVPARVHGGLTFSEADVLCGGKGMSDEDIDNGWWIGFDCMHGGSDAPDPGLPTRIPGLFDGLPSYPMEHVWSQAEVESECRLLCAQVVLFAG